MQQQQQQRRCLCPLSSVSSPKPPSRTGQAEVNNDGGRVDGKHNASDMHCYGAPRADEEHVIQASTYALWEQLYAPARVPLTVERLLYLRLSAKSNGENNEDRSRQYCADDLQWAGLLFGEIAAQSDVSAPSVPMVPSTASAMAKPPHESCQNEREEEPQRTRKGGMPDGASSVAAKPTEQGASAEVEQVPVPTALRAPCAFSDSSLDVHPGWKADAAALVQLPPQLKEQHHQESLANSTKAAEPAQQHVAQTCTNAQSASGVGGGQVSIPRRAVTPLSHPDTVSASTSLPSLLSSVPRPSDSNRGVDHGGGGGGTVLLLPCRGCAMPAASPPDWVLPSSTSVISFPSASPVPASDAAAVEDRIKKATAAPMSLERDDSNDCGDGNVEVEPRDDTCLVEAASAAPAQHMHTRSTPVDAMRADEEDRRDGPGGDGVCSPPLGHSAFRGGDEEGRGAADDEQAHTVAPQDESAQTPGAWEIATTTTTPSRLHHQCHHRSSHDTDPCTEGCRRDNEEGAKHTGGGEEEDDDVGFLSLTTSPLTGAPEQRRSCPVGGSYAKLPTPSPGQIGMLAGTRPALPVSALLCSLKRNEEDRRQLDSPTRHRIATKVSTSISPVTDLDGLVLSPPRRQQMRLQLQRCCSRQPSEGGDMEYSDLTSVPGSQSPPPASSAPSLTSLADSGAGATDELRAGGHAADAAVMRDSPRRETHANNKREAAAATAKENDAEPWDATALDLPVDEPCSAEADEDNGARCDGGLVASVTVRIMNERVRGDDESEESGVGTPASMVSVPRQPPSLARPDGGAEPQGVHDEGHAVCGPSSGAKAGSNDGERAARTANAVLVSPSSTSPSSPHVDHESFWSPKHSEDPQQRHQQLSLPEVTAARRSVSSMDFRWADEADSVLRRQQQRLRSLQAVRTATLAGSDVRRSPSTNRCSPGDGPRHYVPLSQDGGSVQGSQDGNGARRARLYGGSETSYSVSPQPQEPRAYNYSEKLVMRSEATRVETVASRTDGSGIATELREVASSSHRSGKSEELACLSISRSDERLAAVAAATAVDDASVLRTDQLLQQQQQQPSPRHAGVKRQRENHGGNDDSSDAARARHSPAPSCVPVYNQTTKEKGDCSGDGQPVQRRHRADDRVRGRQRLRGDVVVTTTTRMISSPSPANVFALPRTITADPAAPIAAPPFTTMTTPLAGPSLSRLRTVTVNSVDAPPAAQAQKTAKGKPTRVGVASSAVITAPPLSRKNASSRAHKNAPRAARRPPSLVALKKQRETE
ncbi:hypothetical protein MNV84_00455 [Leishmania braziliensis]|nr:hypothetical protein MNV84_00455 [Leishmania braziliensis]